METRNWELARAMVRRGHQVTLAGFCAPLPGEPGLLVRPLGRHPRLYNAAGQRSTRGAVRFAAAAARIDVAAYDLVETANMPYAHLPGLALRCTLAGKPLLVSWYEYWAGYWGGYVGRARAPFYRLAEWLTAQLGDAVLATSRLTQERLALRRHRRGGVPLVPCGIEVGRVQGAAARAGGAPAPPLVYAGRLLAHKRLDLLLAALPPLAARWRGEGPLLTVFGEGPDRPRLEALAAELGVGGRVRFRGHVETSEQVWSELALAKLAVQPSAREGFGLFPLEAMAAGLPVVHCESSESAVAELVRDGIEGAEAPPEPAALAAILAGLLADEPRRSRLAEAARARAAEYDYGAIAERFEETCVGLVEEKKGGDKPRPYVRSRTSS